MNTFPRRSKRSESLRKRGWDGETSLRDAAATQKGKKAREEQTGGFGEERVSKSHANSARRRGEERNVEQLGKVAGEETRERAFSRERQEMNEQQQEEEVREEEQETGDVPRSERQATQEGPVDIEDAVKKLTERKEYFADLCRHYLANYKIRGADVRFWLSSSTTQCSTDSRNTKCQQQDRILEERNAAGRADSWNTTCPEKVGTFEERNAAGRTGSFSAAVAHPPCHRLRPPASNQQPAPECECRRMPSDVGIERLASFSGAHRPRSTNCQPPPECRTMPSNFDGFLKSSVLQLNYDPSNALYREELSALESRALLVLESFQRMEQLADGDRGVVPSECAGTIVRNASARKCDASKLSQFQSYQFSFRAAAVAEIVRLKSELMRTRIEPTELPLEDTMGNGFSGVRTPNELAKRLKLEKESAAKELDQLRAEKLAKEESLAEIQGVKRNLESRISSCACNNISPGTKKGAPTIYESAPCELECRSDANKTDGVFEQRQKDGRNEMGPRLKAMGGCHASVSVEDEARLERICEVSVEREVVKLVAEKLEKVKAEMGDFVKTLQSRIAGVAGKINTDESRVRPVRVGLVCLQFLIEKLLAKKAEIEASLVDKTSDNRLGLKLHFRS